MITIIKDLIQEAVQNTPILTQGLLLTTTVSSVYLLARSFNHKARLDNQFEYLIHMTKSILDNNNSISNQEERLNLHADTISELLKITSAHTTSLIDLIGDNDIKINKFLDDLSIKVEKDNVYKNNKNKEENE